MTIRNCLTVGLLLLALLGSFQGGAALLGNKSLQRKMVRQTELLSAVTHAASAQLAFERADRAAKASRGAANPVRRRAFADMFRAEAEVLHAALASALVLEPTLETLLVSTADWARQTDVRLPGSKAGPQVVLLRDDLLTEMGEVRQAEIAAAVTDMLQRAEAARAEAVQVAGTVQSAITVIVALWLLASLWLAFMLRSRVLRPLRALTETTRRLAGGELGRCVEGVARRDEIGAVAIALEALRLGALHTLSVEAAAAQDRSAAEARFRYLAHHDQLTGLANRVMMHERLEYSLALARRSQQQVALFWIDLDRFKAVNDSRGHAAGDALLREVARRILETVRETDTVARLGGDEFVVIQVGAGSSHAACQLAARLTASLSELYETGDGQHATVTASIGIAMYPEDGETAVALLASADLAMYRAKASGRDRFALFHADMDQEAQARRGLEQDLRLALDRQQFDIVYQPQLDLLTGEVLGFEALLRWRPPDRAHVPPDQFIPVAESSGSIVPIGAWVLHQACREAMRWANPLRIAVNVSPVQFQQCDMAVVVAEALRTSGLDPSRLEIEITEGVLICDPVRTLDSLQRIRRSGVTVALDDFGTGYSSLSTLRTFPFDRIKIDRSFVKDLPSDGDAAAIVHAVLGLARGLGLPVVAEGVETTEQLAILQDAGCAEVQGYLVGRPMPIAAFAHVTQHLAVHATPTPGDPALQRVFARKEDPFAALIRSPELPVP